MPTSPGIASSAAAAATTIAEPIVEVQAPHVNLEPPIEELTPSEEVFEIEETIAKTADVDTRILADAPVDEPPPSTQYIPPTTFSRATLEPPPPAPPAPAPEPENHLAPNQKPAKTPEPKQDKMPPSVDV